MREFAGRVASSFLSSEATAKRCDCSMIDRLHISAALLKIDHSCLCFFIPGLKWITNGKGEILDEVHVFFICLGGITRAVLNGVDS